MTAGNYAQYGIRTVTSMGTEISNNDVDFDILCCDDRSGAISSQGCNDEVISQNYVGGSRGVLANNTAGNTYECNVISHTHAYNALGILYNSLGQRIRGNSLECDSDDLSIRSVIGEQDHHGNIFSGAGERVFAEDQDIADASRFYVNSTHAFHMPVEVDPPGWFEDEPWINNYYVCTQGPGQGPNWIPFWDGDDVVCTYYNKVIEDHGYESMDYIRMIQTMLRYGQQRIDYTLPDCITGDPVLPECWVLLTQAERDILDIGDDEESGEEGSMLIGKVEGISAAYGVDSSAASYVLQHQDELVLLTSEEMDRQDTLALRLEGVKDLLAEVDCTDSIMVVALPIMEEYVRYLEAADKDTLDYAALIQYSRYCVDDYGPYIHLARALVYPYTDEDFGIYDDCRVPLEERSRARRVRGQTIIYPNPSSGQTTIDFSIERSGQVIVQDIAGRVVSTQAFSNQTSTRLIIDKAGLYLVQIAYAEGDVETIKHIVTQ